MRGSDQRTIPDESKDLATLKSQLEAKGVKFKRAQDGTIEELHVGPDALLTLDDYRVLGGYRETLRRVSLCAKEPALNGAVLAAASVPFSSRSM